MAILIQPIAEAWKDWETLSIREGLGFEVLDLSTPDALEDAALAARRVALYRRGGRVRSLHGAFIDVNPASGDPLFRCLSQRRCRESCEAAKALGAERVVFHSSCFPFLRGTYLEHWAAACADFYTALAEEYDIAVCIENSPDVDPTPLEELMRRASDGRVGLCLDLGHANYSRIPLEAWFTRLGGRIGCLHLSDNYGSYDDHLPLGDGTVDWAAADRLWRGLEKDVPMTLEVGGIEGVERSLRFLREQGYFGLEVRQ